MYSRYILMVYLSVLMESGYSRPKTKTLSAEIDSDLTIKEWETNKPKISLLKQLEKSGIGVKRSAESDQIPPELSRLEVLGNVKDTALVDDLVDLKSGEQPQDESSTRVKKQSPNNVCIKIGGCGKTVCGPIVSARGPGVSEMRNLIQNISPVESIHPAAMAEMNDASSKIPSYSGMQGRTVDLMGLAPTLSLGYGTPAVYSAPVAPAPESSAIGYGHSFIKPPAVPTVPAVPVAVITQHQPHPIVHPSWVLPHLLPHVMPHLLPGLMPSLASFVTPHRFESQSFQELPQPEIKQPTPALPQFSYAAPDTALICQPVRNQRFDNSYDFMYKPDVAMDKSLNVSEAAKTSSDEEAKIQDHLRKVNEIKEEISQLNRAAQRIVDQQERLTEMQQKQLWTSPSTSSSSMPGSMHGSMHSSMHGSMSGSDHPATSYMGSGYYTHPTMPWGYSRSSILSYPNTHDDIEFFLNLLRAGKKLGAISDTLQPVLSTVSEVIKGGQETPKMQKDSTDSIKSASRMDDVKPTQTIKSA